MNRRNKIMNARNNSKLIEKSKENEEKLFKSKKSYNHNISTEDLAEIPLTENLVQIMPTNPSELNSMTNKRKGEKIRFCKICNKNDTSRSIVECYVCKTVKCRPCAGISHKTKKKEHSNLICSECIGSDTLKKR
jgi:hypothetical protein